MSFYYKRDKKKAQRQMTIYVDDTLTCGNKQFQKLIDLIPETFESEPR